MTRVFDRGSLTGEKIAKRLSTRDGKVTLQNDTDFYIKESGETPRYIGYLASDNRFVLWDIPRTIIAKKFAKKIPGY